MPLAADGTRRLARVLQALFAGQARDLSTRLTVEGVADGGPVDLSHWVAPMAQAVRPLLLGFWQAGALRTALRLRPGYRGRDGLRTYAPGNETIFSPRKGVMFHAKQLSKDLRVQSMQPTLLQVTKAGRGSGEPGDPATGVLVHPLNHPGRPSLTPLQAWHVSKAAGNLGLGFDVANPRVLDAVDQAALSFCRETLDTVAGDVREALADLRGVLREGVPRGDAQQAIARRVRRIFADPYRAFRIAVTESSRATHGGQLLAAKDMGASVKTWVASAGACKRCLALDGKQVGIDEAFDVDPKGGPYAVTYHPPLHPHCCLGETPVWAPGRISGIVAQFEGPIIRVTFADGYNVSVTPNHLFLTTQGFMPAASLMHGDKIIRCLVGQGESLCDPDNDQQPALIQDVVRSLAESSGGSAASVPVTPEYIHGDAAFCQGYIDVVRPYGLLRGNGSGTAAQQVNEDLLGRIDNAFSLNRCGKLGQVLFALGSSADGGMGSFRESRAFLRAALRRKQGLGFTISAERYPCFLESVQNDKSTNSEGDSYARWGFTGEVTSYDFLDGIRSLPTSGGGFSHGSERNPRFVETASDGMDTDPKGLADALGRFSGQVTSCDVLYVEVLHFRGPVYDLETTSSLYCMGNGVVSSNCFCDETEEF